jgi:16S rRNA (guanine527-N7)-methyltransferase
VSRAVAPLGELWKWSKPLLRKTKAMSENGDQVVPSAGLICLKGGDLHKEIQLSGTRPRMIEIAELFEEEYFKEKYLLQVIL